MLWKVAPNTKYSREIVNTMMRLLLSSKSERLRRLLKAYDTKCRNDMSLNKVNLVNKVLQNRKLLAKIDEVIESGGNLNGYLYCVAVNLLSNELRTFPLDIFERPEKLVPIDRFQLPITPSPERVYLHQEFICLVEGYFTDDEIDIMLDCLTAAELARRIGMKPNTVVQRLRRKKQRFALRHSEYADLDRVL